MDSLLSFPVGLFHPLQHAGLSQRTPSRRLAGQNPAPTNAGLKYTIQSRARKTDIPVQIKYGENSMAPLDELVGNEGAFRVGSRGDDEKANHNPPFMALAVKVGKS